MNREEMWNAVVNCDAEYDGKFYYAVKSTGIYCRPSCKSRQPKWENVAFFRTWEEAEQAGFRPCKRCRPDLLEYDPAVELAQDTKRLIDAHFSDRARLSADMRHMGVTRKHLTEVFKKEYDITPSEYIKQTKIAHARQLLQDGTDILETADTVGFPNLSQFYDQFRKQTGMTPARYRQLFADNISRMQMETPIGTMRLIASSDSVLCIEKGELQEDRILHSNPSGELLQQCGQELKEYFAGKRRRFDLPLAPEGTDFQKNVWAQLQNIPYGETRTYRELAEMTGNAKAARAVGMANHCNPILIVVPCHRVIGADGSLTGYAARLEAKKYLLRLEEGLAHA